MPTVDNTGTSVGSIVAACHARPIDEALSEIDHPGLDRKTLDDVLNYCAKRVCEQNDATCPGCKLRTQSRRLDTFDKFVAAHQEISSADGTLVLRGTGDTQLTVPSLEHLIKTWAGEEYWYWARRVLRKLRHGVRGVGKTGQPFAADGEAPAVILVEPQLADNIGMSARAMANFGLDDLRLVNPRDGWPNEKARIAASGANYVIDAATPHADVESAMNDLHWVCATTARQRDLRKPIMTPSQAISEMSDRIARGQRCGILFGPEASGMTTPHLQTADALVMIPVNSAFASLNLAQATLIMGYTWMQTRTDKSLGRVTQLETPIEPGLDMGKDSPATKQQLIGFFEHLEAELDARGFFRPAHRRPTVVHNIRSMFTRTNATTQEVCTLRGIVATLARAKRGTHKSE